MKHLILIAIGGAAGALCRHGLVNIINRVNEDRESWSVFPIATLSVNIIGSFCIGIMYVLIAEKLSLHPDWRSVAIVGFLGAFTTFSTFSLETINLLENGQLANALLYVVSSLIVCILAVWLAIVLTRMV